jgi:DNA-binding winged helix-turn-helix (wHTH) protein/tetratricopeptide (TPR) repeat protein
MSAPFDPVLRFGAFQLDVRTGELRKNGSTINLPEQPFQVLKTLLERPGELVTREELRHRLWSAGTFVDFEHGLNAAVRRLRDALGDSADTPRFIETLPRRGYRFIAPVIQPPATAEAPSHPEEKTIIDAVPTLAVTPVWPRARARVLAVVATTALVTAAIVWVAGYRPWASVSGPAITTSALIPDDRRHSTVAEANDRYLSGRYYWSQDTEAGHRKAMEYFLKAIDLDDSFALAHSALADTYILLGADGFMPMREAYPLAKTAANRALELDDNLGDAHKAMAAIHADYYWNWPEADRHFKRAVALNPSDATTLTAYSFYLAIMKRFDEALDCAERARHSDPVSLPTQMNLGIVLYLANRFDDAVAAFDETLERNPDFGPARVMLGRVYVAKKMPERAVSELEHAQRLMGRRPDVLTPYAFALARAGRTREARQMLDGLRDIAKPKDPAPFRMAMVHIALGEHKRAFEWLDKAFEARDWQMGLLNVEPALDDLRSNRRFDALVERVGLPR